MKFDLRLTKLEHFDENARSVEPCAPKINSASIPCKGSALAAFEIERPLRAGEMPLVTVDGAENDPVQACNGPRTASCRDAGERVSAAGRRRTNGIG